MRRSLMVVVLLTGALCSVAEARGRNRMIRYQANARQYQYPVQSNSGPAQYSVPADSLNSATAIQQVNRPVSRSSVTPVSSSLQAWAEEEVRMMAARGTCGHIRPAPMGTFVGVGCGTTCMGSGVLVAEAHYEGKIVRVWQR